MKLIVGLGNVGERYGHTRHNVGFMVVDRLAKEQRGLRWASDGLRDGFLYREWRSPKVLVARMIYPQTMMNQSGDAVLNAVRRWRVAHEQILLVCDDVNLPLGTMRLRPKGSDGGHHGLASCFEALGTDEVPRLRLGVGSQPLPKDLTEFVLSPFEASERPMIRHAIDRAVEACELWAREGIEVAMNRANTPIP